MLKPLVLLPVLAVALAGCTAPQADNAQDGVVRIVASTNVYGDIAQTIGGAGVEVTSIIDDPAQDPHQFEANGRVQLALSRADIVVVNGGGYDDFATTMLQASGNAAAVVITAVDESGLDTGAEGFNEHVWYDYATVGALASRIADALRTVDPERADAYDDAAFAAGLQRLQDRADALRVTTDGAGAVITEAVPGYLLRALGMTDLTPPEFSAAIEEDGDVSPVLLQRVLNLIGDGSASVVLYNAQTGGPQTDAVLDIASENRVPAIGVTETLPDGTDYLAWQSGYLDLIEDAFR
ncbi:MAG TPA: zinc ABC transporter substrate-binding protein [Pseudolysinimonas sp.]|nr:zinc ABC transporter substrate-binding protein [Pseudolysinimonas sp.]